MRSSLFPNCPPYLNFIGPDETYDKDVVEEDCFKNIQLCVAKGTSPSVLDCFSRLGVTIVKVLYLFIMKYQSEYFHNNYKTCFQWDTDANLRSRGGPVWDHVFVCEKGHFIPFEDLHPAIKVKNFLDVMFWYLQFSRWTHSHQQQLLTGRINYGIATKDFKVKLAENLATSSQKITIYLNRNSNWWQRYTICHK